MCPRIQVRIRCTAVRSEYAGDPVNVGVHDIDIVIVPVQRQCIVGLFVLTPANPTDESLVVQDDPLAAESPADALALEINVGLIDMGTVWVGDDGVVGQAVAQVIEVIVTQVGNVIGLDKQGDSFVTTGTVIEPGLERRRGRRIDDPRLVHRLQAIPKGQPGAAIGEGLRNTVRMLPVRFPGGKAGVEQEQQGHTKYSVHSAIFVES